MRKSLSIYILTLSATILGYNSASGKEYCLKNESFLDYIGYIQPHTRPPFKVRVAVVDMAIPNGHRCAKKVNFDILTQDKGPESSVIKFKNSSIAYHGLDMTMAIMNIAPFAEVKFFSISDFSDQGISFVFNQALDWKPDIINYSISGDDSDGFFPLEHKAFKRAEKEGVIIVGAAGNEDKPLDIFIRYPAEYTVKLKNVISVGTIEKGISNYSSKKVLFNNYGNRVPVIPASKKYKKSTTGSSIATATTTGILAHMLGFRSDSNLKARIDLLKKVSSPYKNAVPRSKFGYIDFEKVNKAIKLYSKVKFRTPSCLKNEALMGNVSSIFSKDKKSSKKRLQCTSLVTK